MANALESDQPEIHFGIQNDPESYHGLEPESYTAQRLVSLRCTGQFLDSNLISSLAPCFRTSSKFDHETVLYRPYS
jgi:hypothetical protein